jgi:hypothetical protein
MRSLWPALLVLACAAGARAQGVRVEPRLFVKEGHFFTSLGGAWLERGDYWQSPGLSLSAAYYPTESGGAEARLIFLFSSLSASAQEISAATGFVPEARKPEALALAGWRQSFTYGKLAIAGEALHFDLQGALHGGGLFTDGGFAPAACASAGFLARLNRWVFLQLDLGLLLSFEQRQKSGVSAGFLPILSMGAEL